LITRHRLKKKDPNAETSDAIKPIIYYMDPGAPEPIRSALIDGARWWNQAFEAAGYTNAFQVEFLPEDADPMDVRYNIINWVHRSTRGWSYGTSITDPRTGEILKGHVNLGSLRVRQDFLIAEGLLAPYEEGKPASKVMEQMALARLRQLAAHEVGHTLGLAHAYTSSSESLASVMDYPHPVAKVVNGKIDLSEAYDTKIGAFDKVSIRYGYSDFPTDSDEEKELNDIIQKSLQSGLTFLSDQDARPTGSPHPYAHLWDNGSNPIDELNRVLEVRSIAIKNFGEKNIKVGDPMALLEEAFVPVYFFHRYQVEAVTKIIGGMTYSYALRGDNQPITGFLSPDMQSKALDAIIATVTPSVLALPENLIRSIPPRPIGYSRHRELIKTRTDLAFDPLSVVESSADMTFGLLLHPARATRLIEHNTRDNKQPSLESVIDRVSSATLKAAIKPGFEGSVQMTVNYVWITNLTQLALSKNASAQARAVAFQKLDQLKTWLVTKSGTTTDESWKAHYNYLVIQIKKLQEDPDDFKEDNFLPAPPGMPIGELDRY
jgi:hypothetical protein